MKMLELAVSGIRIKRRLCQCACRSSKVQNRSGLQLQRASYVQRVKSADTESWTVSPGKIGAGFPGAIWKG